MAFCGKCGAALARETGFCGSCGAAITPARPEPVSSAGEAVAGWASVNPASQAPAPSWSPVANQQSQSAEWNHVQGQAATAAATPAAQGWNAMPGSAPGATPAPPPPSSAVAAPSMVATGTGLTPNLAGALAYSLGIITGVLFLVLEPYRRDRFVRFHAMQSILYFVVAVAFGIAWRIMVGILMSFSGWIALASVPIRLLISLGMFCLWLFLMYQAYSGREFSIPVLGGIARKQADSQV
jgi:uncharacterized membrane protein